MISSVLIKNRYHTNLQPNQRDAVDTIGNSGNHLLALINDVLDLSKIEAGRMELHEADFDLVASIEGISAMFQIRCEQKDLEWEVVWKRGSEGTRRRSPLTNSGAWR